MHSSHHNVLTLTCSVQKVFAMVLYPEDVTRTMESENRGTAHKPYN